MGQASKRTTGEIFDVQDHGSIVLLFLLAIVLLHLVSALVAGLLVYELVSLIAPLIERHLLHRWSPFFIEPRGAWAGSRVEPV